ncbi:hypothetical protein FA13DRAFT_778974 [Coprinellus micaceus]|uniref:Zn(2)-C6 fungal-type domain-containing protein n=1 Tax=Coprinellus micaceus TaxID=71717 RepID=A0A4Y7T430_COPMI|nr:hypothetical protein FA13DRAFT_778974 [Coprinellus micaceus]
MKRKYASKTLGPGPTSPGQPASQALKRLLDPKKPKMACYFCRDRKIACGNPGEGALDRTCDQCRKRQLPCAYSTQSRRGIRSDKKKDTGAN